MKGTAVVLFITALVAVPVSTSGEDPTAEAYRLDTGLVSRSISFENPTGAPAQGGRVASPLGVGRKGAPARMVEPGDDLELARIEGPGTIRHIWMTTRQDPVLLRGLVIRAYWDDQKHPSIEAPLGDFYGFAHGIRSNRPCTR
jgi:hypothetical protein